MSLLLGGIGVDRLAQREMRRDHARHLEGVRNAMVQGLRTWLGGQQSVARIWTTNEEAHALVNEIAASGSDATAEELLALPAQVRLRRLLKPVCESWGYAGFGVIDAGGRILASSTDLTVGTRIHTSLIPLLDRALRGDIVVTPPFRSEHPFPDRNGHPHPGQLVMLAGGPVRNAAGDVVAVLAFRIRPEESFAQLLAVAADPGGESESYAVDSQGVLLTEPRFTEVLQARGVLGPTDRAASTLAVRDPGADLRDATPLADSWLRFPLTRAVASVVQGHTGVDTAGYRSYHGRRTLGAWAWLPEYQIGVVTEIDQASAQRVLEGPRKALGLATGLLFLSAVGGIASAQVFAQLGRRVMAMESLGQYRLVGTLGTGGMGTVYLAHHALLRRPTAVKVMRDDALTPVDLTRFEREVQVTARLRHPNTVQIYDYGTTDDGGFFYAMEYLRGFTLEQLVERFGPQPDGRIAHILECVCGSLGEAHRLGFVHRDVKPSNVMLCDQGGIADFVKVLDFGLVRPLLGDRPGPRATGGGIVGTPSYMPPEAFDTPGKVAPCGDLYSVGALGYYLLTGEPPFQSDNIFETFDGHRHQAPRPPSERLGRVVDPDLERLLLHCLEKDTGRRPSDAAAVAAALVACACHASWPQSAARAWWDEHAADVPEPPTGTTHESKPSQDPTVILARRAGR